jgi:hypothetical protein
MTKVVRTLVDLGDLLGTELALKLLLTQLFLKLLKTLLLLLFLLLLKEKDLPLMLMESRRLGDRKHPRWRGALVLLLFPLLLL